MDALQRLHLYGYRVSKELLLNVQDLNGLPLGIDQVLMPLASDNSGQNQRFFHLARAFCSYFNAGGTVEGFTQIFQRFVELTQHVDAVLPTLQLDDSQLVYLGDAPPPAPVHIFQKGDSQKYYLATEDEFTGEVEGDEIGRWLHPIEEGILDIL